MQGHIDMVCEKNNDVQHDFHKDPLKLIKKGDWLKVPFTALQLQCSAELTTSYGACNLFVAGLRQACIRQESLSFSTSPGTSISVHSLCHPRPCQLQLCRCKHHAGNLSLATFYFLDSLKEKPF